MKNLLHLAGARVVGIPVGSGGIDLEALDRARPKVLVVTSSFQNPTGATLPLAAREQLLRIASAHGFVVVENGIYGDLVYSGDPVAPVKQIDREGRTLLLRSFSKIAFPGLRVGWAIGPRPLIARMTGLKQLSDLHTDQLSQAVLLRFAQSGRLETHRARILAAGAERLDAVLAACRDFLPSGSHYTRPRGGMNLWVRLPQPLDAGELLTHAQQEGVAYLPGKYFAVSRQDPGALRLSFACLAPDKIRAGMEILGRVFSTEVKRTETVRPVEAAPALV